MFAALLDTANKSSCVDSLEAAVADWFILIRITGLRCAEYAQKTQSAVNEHIYPSGKHVIKAFIPTDWKFYKENGKNSHRPPSRQRNQNIPCQTASHLPNTKKKKEWTIHYFGC